MPAVSVAQTLYSVGGASLLQSIDTDNQQVEDLVTIVPLMSDIAFHPNGNLYGVSENSIYLIDEGDGTTQEIK